MKTVFSNSSLKIPKRKILGEKSQVLFMWNLVWTLFYLIINL